MPVAVPATEFPAKYDPYTEAGQWDALTLQADTVFGYDLAKDELADALCGVEFIVTGMTFRPGIIRDALQYAYVSLETVISPRLHVARVNVGRRASGGRDAGLPDLTTLDDLPFEPGSHVVINDGSTGIYRQSVQYLYAKQFITLPEPITEGGEHGKSTYDLPPSTWGSINPNLGYISADESGFIGATVNVRLKCPRGLRLSRYPNPSQPKETSTTRYFG
jgi:hypothetical protein